MRKYTSKLYIVRSLPLIRDSRLQRYNAYLDDDVNYITWEDHDENNRFPRLGRKDYNLVISYPIFLIRLFVLSLFSVRRRDKVICMDLDTYIPIKIGSFLSRTKVYLDIVDPIAETKFRKFFYPKIFDLVEFLIISKSSNIILPSKSRLEYYKDKLSLNFCLSDLSPYICENVPKIMASKISKNSTRGGAGIVKIGYFGSLDETRGIMEMIDFYKNRTDVIIIVAGMGFLEKDIEELSKEVRNLQFLGKYKPFDIQELYSLVDFVWAFYSPEVFLHRYACPNKYYEHLAFKVPIIVNDILPQSKEIASMNSGIVIDNTLDLDCFIRMNEKIFNYSYQIANFSKWEREYSNYSFSLD